jgi:lysozyme
MATLKKKNTTKTPTQVNKVMWIIILLGSLGTFCYLIYHWNEDRQLLFRYTDFGILVPMNYAIHGIDVSKYQLSINWEKVKAAKSGKISMQFAFIKSTEGIMSIDPQFKINWNSAQNARITKGAYHFFIATKSGKLQAQHFIAQVKLKKGDLPPVLDVEASYGVNNKDLKMRVQEWLNIVEEQYNVRPIIYTNIDFYKNNLGNDFDEYPLWIAHYTLHHQPRIQRNWLFWQHSEKGKIPGIKAFVDFNVFNGDSAAFHHILIK